MIFLYKFGLAKLKIEIILIFSFIIQIKELNMSDGVNIFLVMLVVVKFFSKGLDELSPGHFWTFGIKKEIICKPKILQDFRNVPDIYSRNF